MEIISQSLAETEQAAADFLNNLIRRPRNTRNRGAAVVGLQGNLGSGKTTFAQSIGRALGVEDRMASPTFVLIKNYQVQCQGLPLPNKGNPFYPWRRLVHIDCYRLDEPSDLEKLDWQELIADPTNLILIEWPERVAEILPANAAKIKFEVIGDDSRKIIYD